MTLKNRIANSKGKEQTFLKKFKNVRARRISQGKEQTFFNFLKNARARRISQRCEILSQVIHE